MSKQEKLIERFLSHPKDFRYDELIRLLSIFGYHPMSKGKTSGSRVIFTNKHRMSINMHKPHNRNYLLPYQISELEKILRKEDLL